MTDYKIIDAHVHTYQTREIGLQAKQGSTATDYAGTIEELLPLMEKAGISTSVMVNMLPLADMRDSAVERLPADLAGPERRWALTEIDDKMLSRLERRNQWTCLVGHEHPSLVPFINLDPLMDEGPMLSEIEAKVNNQKAKGIKLHPAVQRFYPNDRRMWPAYRAASELQLPVVFHGGGFASGVDFARPKHFAEVLGAFPSLTVVMAHIGMGFVEEAVSLAKTSPNLQFDCSAIISATTEGHSDADLTGLIKEIGTERVMFGSDFPWFDPAEAAGRIVRMDFSETEKRQLLSENAVRILGLPDV
jgi:predicted TIM-barrel fold metal-dependent hydrolase